MKVNFNDNRAAKNNAKERLSTSTFQGLPELADFNSEDLYSVIQHVDIAEQNNPQCGSVRNTRDAPYSTSLTRIPNSISTLSVPPSIPPPPIPELAQISPILPESSSTYHGPAYRSSVSSSNASLKRSYASSPHSRSSSVSSLSDDNTARGRPNNIRENTGDLHERLKKRPLSRRQRRSRKSEDDPAAAENITTTVQKLPYSTSLVGSVLVVSPKLERRKLGTDDNRGERLGRAMADGIAWSPPATTRKLREPEICLLSETTATCQNDQKMHTRHTAAGKNKRRAIGTMLKTLEITTDSAQTRLMRSLDNIDDLKACAMVNKDFYNAYKQDEFRIVEEVLRRQSIPAWILRQSTSDRERPSSFHMRSVCRDLETIAALEDFIVWKCQGILRSASLQALLDTKCIRKRELEDGLWRVWMFCNLFGKSSGRDVGLSMQTQWLRGQASKGSEANMTAQTLTMQQLEDMQEMWLCLETLLAGFKGRGSEARQVGLFDHVSTDDLSDNELLQEWIADILSLGPKAVLTLSSCDFAQARTLGVTKWTPAREGQSRVNFLKGAIEEVYRDKLMQDAQQKAREYRKSIQAGHLLQQPVQRKDSRSPDKAYKVLGIGSPSVSPRLNSQTFREAKLSTPDKPQTQEADIQKPGNSSTVNIRPDCDPLSTADLDDDNLMTASRTNPAIFSPISMTSNASARLGSSLFPLWKSNTKRRSQHIEPEPVILPESQRPGTGVIDPADQAMMNLVYVRGYAECDAKRALAMSDTGAGTDFERAVQILSSKSYTIPQRLPAISELEADTRGAQLEPRRERQKLQQCRGTHGTIMVTEPKRERITGLGYVRRNMTQRLSFRKSAKLSVIVDESESQTSRASSPSRPESPQLEEFRLSDEANEKEVSYGYDFLQSFDFGDIRDDLMASGALPDMVDPLRMRSDTTVIIPRGSDHESMEKPTSAHSSNGISMHSLSIKPKVTLARVGTGHKKQGWKLPGMRRKEETIEPEIIGYAY